jgi:hypothetical protein
MADGYTAIEGEKNLKRARKLLDALGVPPDFAEVRITPGQDGMPRVLWASKPPEPPRVKGRKVKT